LFDVGDAAEHHVFVIVVIHFFLRLLEFVVVVIETFIVIHAEDVFEAETISG
jgi:hypothetical protein